MNRKARMKIVTLVISAALLVLSLGVNTAFAYFSTPVQMTSLETEASMGASTQYEFVGPSPERLPQFYSAIIVHGSTGYDVYFPWDMKVTVTGTDPNGNTLTGDRFGDPTVLVSPDGSTQEQWILKTIFDYLTAVCPIPGLDSLVKDTMSSGGVTPGYDGTSAWAEWTFNKLFPVIKKDMGLSFGFQLKVDKSLGGVYTMNIHYHTEIFAANPNGWGFAGYLDLYDVLSYNYVNNPLAPSQPTGDNTGLVGTSHSYSASTTDPNQDMLKYEFKWDDGSYTWVPNNINDSNTSNWVASGTPVSASHTWNSPGTYNVEVGALDSTLAWSGWSQPLVVTINGALCASKTTTAGWFRVPNPAYVNATFLRVEMLFNDTNLAGDQTGNATTPYPAIANYPDGKVDMRDIGVVSRAYGSYEGQSNWNYMADLTGPNGVPDGKVDMRDMGVISRNYGKTGSYTDVLAGVQVLFNTGDIESPNALGFVAIPSGATSFNVTQNGTPIGAMIIFWGT